MKFHLLVNGDLVHDWVSKVDENTLVHILMDETIIPDVEDLFLYTKTETFIPVEKDVFPFNEEPNQPHDVVYLKNYKTSRWIVQKGSEVVTTFENVERHVCSPSGKYVFLLHLPNQWRILQTDTFATIFQGFLPDFDEDYYISAAAFSSDETEIHVFEDQYVHTLSVADGTRSTKTLDDSTDPFIFNAYTMSGSKIILSGCKQDTPHILLYDTVSRIIVHNTEFEDRKCLLHVYVSKNLSTVLTFYDTAVALFKLTGDTLEGVRSFDVAGTCSIHGVTPNNRHVLLRDQTSSENCILFQHVYTEKVTCFKVPSESAKSSLHYFLGAYFIYDEDANMYKRLVL